MSLEELILTYGYAAVAIGSFIEGETVLVLGGFAANRGYLELPWVIVTAFLGALFGDQLYFYLGRIKGRSAIEKHPHWKTKSQYALELLHKNQVWLILGFRFIYGMRIVTPFLIGASNVSPIRFLVLNIIGASLWSVTIGVLGYLFGGALEIILGDIKRYELLVFFMLALIGAAIWLIRIRKNRTAKKPIQSAPKKQRD
jgi:membrane protein DedA with SNARE-associated domain